MGWARSIRDVTVFVSLYLVLSLPPFVGLYGDSLGDILGLAVLAAAGTAGLVTVTGLILVSEGVERYNQFLVAPTDALSVLVAAAFVVAATSWWLVPELAFALELDPGLGELVVGVLASHLPMVLFLSLLTAAGNV